MVGKFSCKNLLLLSLFFVNASFCMQSTKSDLIITEIDTKQITDILNHVGDTGKKTIFVCDIDGVAILPKQLLGNDPWAYYEGDKYIARCGDVKKGLQEFREVWSFVQNHVDVKLVDEKFKNVLETLKASCIKVMGFTARGMDLVDRTKYQLDSVGVDFYDNAYCAKDIETADYINKNGILFVNLGVSKGDILKKFFDKIGDKPDKIVFIDDQPKNIATIKAMCAKENISFVGIRYGGADDIVKLDGNKKKICDIQLDYLKKFNVVLSDEEAQKKMDIIS